MTTSIRDVPQELRQLHATMVKYIAFKLWAQDHLGATASYYSMNGVPVVPKRSRGVDFVYPEALVSVFALGTEE